MGCKTQSTQPSILCQVPARTPSLLFLCTKQRRSCFPRLPKADDAYSISFKTLGDCKLGVSRYPDFEYNAEGGIGTGTGSKVTNGNELSVTLCSTLVKLNDQVPGNAIATVFYD